MPVPPDFLQGVIAPMLTPIHADGSLDLEGAAAFVERLVSRGCVRTVFARSGMGKMFTFTVEETKAFGEAVVRAADGRIGVLLGAAGEWLTRDQDRACRPDSETYLAQAIELTRYAEKIGADGAVHVLPEPMTPSRDETIADAIFGYVRAVHDASTIPIVLYQPGGLLPEYRMTPDLLRRLRELPRLAGMKVSTGEDAVFGPLADVVRGTEFALIAGDETYYRRGLEQGAVGVIGEGCNVYPEMLEAIRARYRAGDFDGATRAQADVGRALKIKEGLDGAVIWKQVLIEQGVRILPFDRSGKAPYAEAEAKRVAGELQAILASYS